MTEHEWLTSMDPLAMLAHWSECAGEPSELAADVASDCDSIRDVIGDPFVRVPFWESDGKLWCPLKSRTPGTRRWGDVTHWMTWRDGTIPAIARKIYNGKPCGKCQEIHGKRCVYEFAGPDSRWVKCKCRWRADPNDFAILADAMEEAGCVEATILDHLRGTEKCPWCGGSGNEDVSKEPCSTAIRDCRQCDGKGFRPVSHTRECWAIRLLRGGVV